MLCMSVRHVESLVRAKFELCQIARKYTEFTGVTDKCQNDAD